MATQSLGYMRGILDLYSLVGLRHPSSEALADEVLQVGGFSRAKKTTAVETLGPLLQEGGDFQTSVNSYRGDTPEEELAGVQETLKKLRPKYTSIGTAASLVKAIEERVALMKPDADPEPALESTMASREGSSTPEAA